MVGKILLFNKKTKPAFAESANIPEWKALPCSALAAAGLHVQGFFGDWGACLLPWGGPLETIECLQAVSLEKGEEVSYMGQWGWGSLTTYQKMKMHEEKQHLVDE